jgi:hypothetical protein
VPPPPGGTVTGYPAVPARYKLPGGKPGHTVALRSPYTSETSFPERIEIARLQKKIELPEKENERKDRQLKDISDILSAPLKGISTDPESIRYVIPIDTSTPD